MGRSKSARKAMASRPPRNLGSLPKTGHISCTYLRSKGRPQPKPPQHHASSNSEDNSSDSARDSEGEESDSSKDAAVGNACTPVPDVAALLANTGVTYTHAVSTAPASLPADVLACFTKVTKKAKWKELPSDKRDALQGLNASYRLYKLQNFGIETYTPKLTRAVRAGEALLCYAGDLYTREAWEQQHPDNTDKVHLWSFDLPAKLLRRRTGYRGPDLVLAGDLRGNEGRFLHDPTWHAKTWPPKPNLYTEVLWTTAPAHPKQVLPYVFFCADCQLEAGTELLLYWGDQCWEALSRHEVMAQAAESWLLHFELRALQEYVAQVKASGRGSDQQQEARHGEEGVAAAAAAAGPSNGGGGGGRHDGGPDTAPQPRPRRASQVGKGVPSAVLFDRNTGRYFDGSEASAAAAEAEAEAEAGGSGGAAGAGASGRGGASAAGEPPPAAVRPQPACIPAPHVAFRRLTQQQVQAAFPGWSAQSSFAKLPPALKAAMERRRTRKVRICGPAKQEEEALIASGELRYCEVAEVRALHHSVRWATPPDCRAHTVLASQPIPAGTPLGIYAGDTCTAHAMDLVNKPEKEVYCYAMSKMQLLAARPEVQWPAKGLVVDALRSGNNARFINDTWGQEGEDREVNVEARVVWSKQQCRPHIMLFAVTAIEKGEELALSYGRNYWLFFARYMQGVQHRFACRTTRKAEALRDWVRRVEGAQRLAQMEREIRGKIDIGAKRLYDE